MYLDPIEQQNDAKKQRRRQDHESRMWRHHLPINKPAETKIVKDEFTCRFHSVDEKQCSSQRMKSQFQPHVASQAAGSNEWRSEFPHRGESVDWCNVQNRRISSLKDQSYRKEPNFEEDRMPNLQAQDLYKHNRSYEWKDANPHYARQSEYEMKNCSSREEYVVMKSSSSGTVNVGSRESCEQHHKHLHTTSAGASAGYRLRHQWRYSDIQDPVISRLAQQNHFGRRSNIPADKEQWVKNGSQGQRDLHPTFTNARTGRKIQTEDYQRAQLLLKSQKLDQDSESESSEVEQEKQCTLRGTSQRKNLSILIPTVIPENKRKPKCIHPSTTTNKATLPSDRCIQVDNLVRLETEKQPPSSRIIPKEGILECAIKKHNIRRSKIPQTPLQQDCSIHHPCYILDNIRIVMSFLSVLEVKRSERVSKMWKIAARSVLNNRTSDDITINPPSTPKMGGRLIQQLEFILPRLQRLTLSLSDFKNIEGPMPFFILKHICDCQDLVFLRIERFTWEMFQWAVKKVLLYRSKGQSIMSTLQVLELPHASLPIPTRTECMKPLSELTPILRSLTLNSAQDPVILSLRVFMPFVKNLILLNALYTTQRFAKMVTSSPLMKHLMKNHAHNYPWKPMLTISKKTNSAAHLSNTKGLSPIISTPSRLLTPGSKPVSINDERLTLLASCHTKQLSVVPGSVYQIETGKKLSKGMLQKYAGFCAMIGSQIIMSPQDNHSTHKRE